MIDIENQGNRFSIIEEILGAENNKRKAKALKNYEIYKDRQEQFVREQLVREFGDKTVNEMRIININMCKRIVNQLASLYINPPERQFVGATEKELEQIDALYEYSQANSKLLLANRFFKLQKQCAIQVIPKDGCIQIRVLSPHQYDVISQDDDPEKAAVYIINTIDKTKYLTGYDQQNQKIADPDDFKKQQMRFVWWTDAFNFETDGNGKIMSEPVPNPIGQLPFIEVSGCSKDFEFWVREGCGPAEFSVTASTVWSDICTINKIQGYAQAVISGDKLPENLMVGPTRVLFLPTDSTSAVQSKFEFVNPNPDLAAALEMLEMLIKTFLSSEGIDPQTISGKADATKYSSGLERMLAMIEKFEASKEDLEVFRWVEYRLFDLLKSWSNIYQGVDFLKPELKNGQINESVDLDVQFATPSVIQTKTETEDSVIKRLDKGLISKVEAVSELRDISLENAMIALEKIAEENQALVDSLAPVDNISTNLPPPINPQDNQQVQ